MTNTSTAKKSFQEDQIEIIKKWVEEHSDYLYRYAFRYFRSEDIAQDLVQECFLSALESYTRFEGRSSPRTWLTSILRHKVLDKLREKTKEINQTPPVDEEKIDFSSFFNRFGWWLNDSGPLNWDCTPDNTYLKKEFLQILGQCLNKLPHRFREIFLLRELEGFSKEELADNLLLTSGNIRVMLHRTRLSLQKCLNTNWR